jgi:predicted DNA binding CopG/RHH family protein
MKRKKYDPEKEKLSKYEQKIDDTVDRDNLAKPSEERQAQLKAAAKNTLKMLKAARTNIRMDNADMVAIRELANKAGIPYQTFIGHILHLYVTGQLIQVEEVKKLVAAGIFNKSKTG